MIGESKQIDYNSPTPKSMALRLIPIFVLFFPVFDILLSLTISFTMPGILTNLIFNTERSEALNFIVD